MSAHKNLSRFVGLLLLVAISLSLVVVAPVEAQGPYNEAPMLAEMVAAGELPPVEERLPVNPRVVEPLDSVGVYGGIWHRAWRGINDFHCYGRVNYDPVLRWPRDPNDPVQPGLAERWEFNEDGTELTLYFREGLRWSDGELFTVNDIVFVGSHRKRHQHYPRRARRMGQPGRTGRG
jgi:peptide/nickel transport system substrate-binding protein